MNKIVGKWIQKPGQPYAGLWFKFKEDGTFEARYEPMGIISSGTYQVEGNQIDVDQSDHTLGFIGEFKGLYEIDGIELKMSLAASADQERPDDLSEARLYEKE